VFFLNSIFFIHEHLSVFSYFNFFIHLLCPRNHGVNCYFRPCVGTYLPTYLPTHYTRWYLVAAAPLADAPSPVVHLPFFAPECRAASDLRSARTTAPGRTSYCAQFFPSLQRLFSFMFCAEIGSRIAPEVDISFCAFLRTTF